MEGLSVTIRPRSGRALTCILAAAPILFPLVLAHAATPEAQAEQPLNLPAVAPVQDCSAMASADVSTAVGAPTVVTSAAVVNDAKSPAYCRLQVVADNYAKFEMHLPVSVWTQRLLFGGGPGAQVAPGAMTLERFVTVSWQDLGHRGHEDDFATNYQYRVNGAYRGMHLQVLAAKALIGKYYGQAPRFSYYNACSEPGREGMMEVQRFPEDFDGVGAGCPPIDFTINNGVFQAWNVLTNTGADGKPIITADKLPILHKAVLEQCDAADGAKDGIVSDPFSCHPDVTAVQCKAGEDAATCLNSAQVHAAQELYRGAHDAQGNKLTPIGVLPGSELAWTATIIPNAGRNPTEARDQTSTAVRSQFNDPALPNTWVVDDLKFNRASFDAITKLHYLYDATDPDLSAFAKAGHKLILWQALGDTNVLPAHAVLYYTALRNLMGAKTTDGFVRFYVLPGVYHCGGGDGPVISDLLAPLMLWVERGIAPGALPGVHIPRPAPGTGPGAQGPGNFGSAGGMAAGGARPPAAPAAPDLTRPIYPYPYIAKYTANGDIKEAGNFVQGPARPAPTTLSNWFGSRFYTPHYEKWCTGNGAAFDCKTSR
jgi:feruloyl esterase